MSVKKYKKHKGYESISREMLQCNEMSLEARGLLAYMESMPENYVFHKTQLQKAFSKNKRASVDRIWDELLDMNYLIAFRKREGKKYVYQYYFSQDGFDESDIESIEKDLLSSGYELAPRINRQTVKTKKTSSEKKKEEKSIEECCEDSVSWDVDFQQPKMDSSKPASNKSNSKKSITKTDETIEPDTNRYEATNLSSSEIYSYGEFEFLSNETIRLLSNFGSEAKSLINKIFEAKRKVEMDYHETLSIRRPIFDKPRLNGELWTEEIEREVKKFIFKYKTGFDEGKPIRDLKGYFYRMMLTFWKTAFVLEMNVSFETLVAQKETEDEGILLRHFPERMTLKQLDREIQVTINKLAVRTSVQ